MGQALALTLLLAIGLGSVEVGTRIAATSMAAELDTALLGPLANASAFTGFMLAACTPWGFFRHWWVLLKFAITVVQLSMGIFLLSPALHDAERLARLGEPPWLTHVVGTGLMASAIAFQAWLSMVKPWRRTPWTRSGKPPTAPTGYFVATVAAVVFDLAVSVSLGAPAPLGEIVVLVTTLIAMRHRLAGTCPDRAPVRRAA